MDAELSWLINTTGANEQWAWASPNSITNDNKGNLYLTGNYAGTAVNFGDTQYRPVTKHNIYVSKIKDIDVTAVKNDLFSQNSFTVSELLTSRNLILR